MAPRRTRTKNFKIYLGKSFMPRGRTASIQMKVLIQKVIDMRVGASFFVDGATRADLEFLRRPLIAAGVNVAIRELVCDEIYQCHGTRVWRQEGPYDEI